MSTFKAVQVVHLSSVHTRFDTRIFLKQCSSLAAAGYQTSLVVADGKGDEVRNGVTILDVGCPRGRIDRMWNVTRRVYQKAYSLDSDIYHIHDPELLPVALKLKRAGKTVIFDSHEDVPKQLLGKPYLNSVSKFLLSRAYKLYEEYAVRRLDAVVAATPFIRDKFATLKVNSVDVNNYPMEGELTVGLGAEPRPKKNQVCYIGGIAAIRGIQEVVQAMALVQSGARLQLGGRFTEPRFEQIVQAEAGWERTDALGWLDREGVARVLEESLAGLVTLRPAINYIDALPVKMFEYMSAGVPVIASNFPLWREIVEGNDCGLCVDPLNPREIAAAIDFLATNPIRARQMGENGQRAVAERYNWRAEEAKLLNLYSKLNNR